jgi:hypothetical protein
VKGLNEPPRETTNQEELASLLKLAEEAVLRQEQSIIRYFYHEVSFKTLNIHCCFFGSKGDELSRSNNIETVPKQMDEQIKDKRLRF